MPPEQIEGKIIDARTDIYALGILLFQMLSGKLPFEKKSEDYLIRQQLTAQPPRLNEVNPEIPSDVADVIARALAKNPNDRQQSVLELCEVFVDAVQIEKPVENVFVEHLSDAESDEKLEVIEDPATEENDNEDNINEPMPENLKVQDSLILKELSSLPDNSKNELAVNSTEPITETVNSQVKKRFWQTSCFRKLGFLGQSLQ